MHVCLVVMNSENETIEQLKVQMAQDPTALLTKFFEACNTEDFLSNPVVVNFLQLLYLVSAHRGSCFYNITTDINLPKNLWQITFGEQLHPNIYAEMPMSVVSFVLLVQISSYCANTNVVLS